jgi:hypothetical protein
MIRLLDPTTGIVAKSVFWLGLVYSAMPFDSGGTAGLSPASTAIPRATGSSLRSFAGAVMPASRHNQDDWKSAAENAGALSVHDCARPSPQG